MTEPKIDTKYVIIDQRAGAELKLINEGTYGCIFHPGINCRGKKEKGNYLTKIQKNAQTVENEYKISSMVRKIKGYTRYFVPIVKQCPVKIAKTYFNEVRQCELFRDEDDDKLAKTTYVSNKIRYVGDTNISNHITSQDTVYGFWKELLETHTYLLKGVEKLLTQNIVHYDVKYNNIMFDSKLGKPVFIDFGISLHIPSLKPHNMKDAFYVFDTYPYWSLDVCICNYMFRELGYEKSTLTKITTNDLELILDVFIYGYEKRTKDGIPEIENGIFSNAIFSQHPEVIIADFKKRMLEYYSPFIGNTWYSLYVHYIEKEIYKTWDTYALAVVYLFVLDDYIRYQQSTYREILAKTKMEYNTYVEMLYHVIFAMPNTRYSPEAMIKELKKQMNSVATVLEKTL
jgi:serine/threonine protein kinase